MYQHIYIFSELQSKLHFSKYWEWIDACQIFKTGYLNHASNWHLKLFLWFLWVILYWNIRKTLYGYILFRCFLFNTKMHVISSSGTLLKLNKLTSSKEVIECISTIQSGNKSSKVIILSIVVVLIKLRYHQDMTHVIRL